VGIKPTPGLLKSNSKFTNSVSSINPFEIIEIFSLSVIVPASIFYYIFFKSVKDLLVMS
jgi:hypothetical protein